MATTTVSTVFASHRSPLEKTGPAGVLTFPGKAVRGPSRNRSLAVKIPEKRICLTPPGLEGTGIVSLQYWKNGFPLGFAQNSPPCCTRPSPSTCSPVLPFLCLPNLKPRLWEIKIVLPSAPSAPGQSRHTQPSGQ